MKMENGGEGWLMKVRKHKTPVSRPGFCNLSILFGGQLRQGGELSLLHLYFYLMVNIYFFSALQLGYNRL